MSATQRKPLRGNHGSAFVISILVLFMLTVDSHMLVAGSALAHDIYGTLRPDASPKTRLWIGRVGILIVGSIPLLLILSGVGEGELVQFNVLLFTALMASSFFMPVVAGIYWTRATKEGAASAMIGGLLVCFGWELWGTANIDPVLPGFLASALLLVAVSLLTPPPPESALAPYRR